MRNREEVDVMAMTFGSLFAGVGGFDLGFERVGMVCKWQVEIDEFATKVLEKHWPNVRRYRDVRECGRENLDPVDVICGGPPCQPVSVAGKRGGKGDDRWLWPEAIRIVGELKPTWAVFENPTGMLSLKQGVLFESTLVALEAEGYEVWPVVLPACGVNAPHQRYRVFIVAHANSGRCQQCDTEEWDIPELNAGGDVLPDADQQGSQGYRRLCECSGEQPVRQDCGTVKRAWEPESGLGGASNGTACGLDGYRGLSAWDGNWEDGVPRVISGQRNRVNRLKCLGNAVVPQLAEVIGRMIVQVSG